MFIARPSTALRILHILRAPNGGLYRHVCDLAGEQARMGHEIGLICDVEPVAIARFPELERSSALGVHRIPMSRAPDFRDFEALRAISAIVEGANPHVLHGHGAKGGAYARLVRRKPGMVALYTPHGGVLHFSWTNPQGALFLAAERLLRERGSGLLFESEFGARAYARKIGVSTGVMRIVPNGLRPEDFADLPGEPTYDAVFVGELRKLKGVNTLLEAAAILSRRRSFRLAIAGTGPDEAAFRAAASAAGLSSSVDFLGYRKAREAFALARVVVVPSQAESFPYVVLEAIASGRPTIATSAGGIPEIFGPYADTLVPPGDAEALAAAIADSLDNPAAAEMRVKGLKERARNLYSVEAMAAAITDFYGELLGADSHGDADSSQPGERVNAA